MTASMLQGRGGPRSFRSERLLRRRRMPVVIGVLAVGIVCSNFAPQRARRLEVAHAIVPPVTLQVVHGSMGCQAVALASEGISMDELQDAFSSWSCNATAHAASKPKCTRTLGFPHVRERFRQAWTARTLLVGSYDTYEWLMKGRVSERGKPPDADAVKGSMRRVILQPHPADLSNEQLREFLAKEYGSSEKVGCLENARNMLERLLSAVSNEDDDAVLTELRSLFQWFRDECPYYRGACSVCGAKGEFIGLVRPSEADEAQGRVSVVELYLCRRSTCDENNATDEMISAEPSQGCSTPSVTHFPRYSSVAAPVFQTRRGRCGEYSTLAMQLLDAIGIDSRWVNNHAGHVWAEAHVAGRWVHIDPCEAAVDTPLIYANDWGRTPDHVLAYAARKVDGAPSADSNATASVEEVTQEYRPPGADPVTEETRAAVSKAIDAAKAVVA